MNDTLKKVDQEGKRSSRRNQKGPRWTLLQRLERLETEIRLQRKRKQRPAGEGRAQKKTEALRDTARETVPKKRQPRDGAAAQTAVRRERPSAQVQAKTETAPVRAGEDGREKAVYHPPAEARHKPLPTPPAEDRTASFGQRVTKQVHHIRRRWRHIRREQRARRFPESNRLPIQSVLLVGGLLPMLGGKLRERLMGRHRRAVRRSGGFAARFEGKLRLRPAAFLCGVGVIAALALFFSFYTFGTTVTYNGREVAKVSSKMAAKSAARDLEKVTAQTLGGSYTIGQNLIRYQNGILPRSEVIDGAAFEEKLSEAIGLVTYGYSLYVDGEIVGATPYKGALDELLSQLQTSVSNEDTISCGFQENVEIKAGYVASERIMNLGYLAEKLYSTKDEEVTYTVKGGDTWSQIANSHGMTSKELLAKNPGYNIDRLSIGEVLTMSAAVPYLTLTVTQRESYLTDIPYEVEYTKTDSLYKGDYKVLSAGQYGKADVTANVTYVNGEETERKVLSYVQLKAPVTEQQAQGTKERPTWLPTGSFRWPCSGTITSRFGYRRSIFGSNYHGGVDIANRYGTAVCAADGGTVIYAGWMSSYGYLVQIDHGNGFVTYYGHNSKLLVSVGQHVYKGQQIARMGSTGNSTGNHCHFEVRYNGVRRNPLNYL